jgi:hypothetical protein
MWGEKTEQGIIKRGNLINGVINNMGAPQESTSF